MSDSSKLDDRRRRARDVYLNAGGYSDDLDLAERAIEAATRVKVTDDVVKIHRLAWLEAYNERLIVECKQHGMARCPFHLDVVDIQKAALAATLAELGFEVES